MALTTNLTKFTPGFQLSNADGTTLQSLVTSLNQVSSAVNSILSGSSSGAYHGTFNGTVGSSTPAAGSFTNVSASGTVTATGGVVRSIAAASTAVTTVLQGLFNMAATSAKTYTLGTPVAGTDLLVLCSGGSTTKRIAKAPAGVSIFGFLSSALGSSKAKTALTMNGKGQNAWLRGLSSVAWYVSAKQGNVAAS